MALDKLVDSTQLDADLTSVANAIRTKGGTSASLAFPADFISAIGDISGGGSKQTKSGTFSGSGGNTVSISCDFAPDVIYVYGDVLTDPSLRGICSISIIKDESIVVTADSSTSTSSEYLLYSATGITGYGTDTTNPYASYSSDTLTIDTVVNSGSYRFASGVTYSYLLIGFGEGSATLITKSINTNGTYNASSDSADGYSQVTVNVPTGTARTSADLTASNLTVTAPAGLYASAATKTLTDANLSAGNIKKDVTIFGTTGTYEGGGGGTDYFAEYISGNLSSYSSNAVTVIGTGCLQSSKLTVIDFPNLVEIAQDGCYGSSITTTYYPKLERIGTRGLRDTYCRYFVLPVLSYCGTDAFRARSGNSLYGMDIGTAGVDSPSTLSLTGMSTYNTQMTTLILRYSSIVKLAKWDVLPSPFANGGSGGTVYIPKSLYDHLGDGTASDYKAASNWSTYEGYGTITWAKIEGSIYETQYVDGTTIPT